MKVACRGLEGDGWKRSKQLIPRQPSTLLVANREVRGGVSQRIPNGCWCNEQFGSVLHLLQSRTPTSVTGVSNTSIFVEWEIKGVSRTVEFYLIFGLKLSWQVWYHHTLFLVLTPPISSFTRKRSTRIVIWCSPSSSSTSWHLKRQPKQYENSFTCWCIASVLREDCILTDMQLSYTKWWIKEIRKDRFTLRCSTNDTPFACTSVTRRNFRECSISVEGWWRSIPFDLL